jgi:iron complex outermembrane receptor protein
MTPNFAIQKSAQLTNNRINIRGVGSAGNNAIESSVGVFIDGVYYPRPGSVIGLLVDIQSFEVLRGPQGTLFGRNTPMGALNITTRNPTRESEGLIEFGAGDYDAVEIGAMYNAALSDSVAARMSIKYTDRDGYATNILDGKDVDARDDLVVRGKVLFDLSDQLSMLVTADYAEINAGGSMIELLNSTRNPVFEARMMAMFGDTPVTEDSFDWKVNQVTKDEINDEQQGVSVDINYEFADGLALRSITAYRGWEAESYISQMRITADLTNAHFFYDTETFSQEIQLISPAGNTVDWMAGIFYYQEDYDIMQWSDLGTEFCVPLIAALAGPGAAAACLAGPQVGAGSADFNQELTSMAAFGQATWNISDSWTATLGARWTNDEKDGDFVQVLYNPMMGLFRVPESTLGMKRDDTKTTGFANINWFPADDVMLFATWSSGYKSGGFNMAGSSENLGAERRIFDPEETTNYELGVKATLLDGTMRANATLFRTDLDDFQDRAFDGLSFIVVNAGEVRQQGVEADINWAPMDQLRIVLGIGYLDSEYLSFDGAPGLPGGPVQDLKGERRNASPEWQTSVAAEWSQPVANGMEWFAGATWSWVDELNAGASSNNNPQSLQDSYSIVNARLGLRSAAGDWDVTLFGNNLTEDDYCLTIFDQPLGAAFGALDPANNTMVQRCALGEPRNWMLTAAYRF